MGCSAHGDTRRHSSFHFAYLPMYGVITGFMDYNLFTGSRIWDNPWVGFKHFEAFCRPEFERILRNTIVISLLKFFIGFPAPIVLALLLNEVRHMLFKRVVQTITYLPHFLSWVIVAGFTTALLSTENGSINILLESLGAIDEPINFLSLKEYFWSILISANVWKEIGFNSIVFLVRLRVLILLSMRSPTSTVQASQANLPDYDSFDYAGHHYLYDSCDRQLAQCRL